jgi:hypothetical protein
MRDDDTLNIYGWWPIGRMPPIAIISMAGFNELPPQGPQTDRVIANVVVSCLAGFYGKMGTHAHGTRDCPLAFNEKRSFKHLFAAQAFDAPCRKKLKRVLGSKLTALDALLKLFH